MAKERLQTDWKKHSRGCRDEHFRIEKLTNITTFALLIILCQQSSKGHSNSKQLYTNSFRGLVEIEHEGGKNAATIFFRSWIKIQRIAFNAPTVHSKFKLESACHALLLTSRDVLKTSVTTALNIVFSPISVFMKVNTAILLLKPLWSDASPKYS